MITFLMFIFLIVSLVLAGLLLSLKKEIRLLSRQLRQNQEGSSKMIDLALLDRDLIALAAELNRTLQLHKKEQRRIQGREKQLREMVTNISHDLRTPLTSIIGHLQLLKKTGLTNAQLEYLTLILARSFRLQSLIRDFYDLSILDSGDSKPDLKDICLDTFLVDGILDFTARFETKNMTPHISFLAKPTFVTADETMLRRIIHNLVSNALCYGERELSITISQTDCLQVHFQNPVRGRRRINVGRIFDRYYRASSNEEPFGTGIGLSIVKLFMEQIGGKAEANLDNGILTISLTFQQSF